MLPLLAAIAFAATACQIIFGPPAIDCGPLSQAECVRWAKIAQRTGEASGKTIRSIHLHRDWWEVIFADGTRVSTTVDFAAPGAPAPVSSQ